MIESLLKGDLRFIDDVGVGRPGWLWWLLLLRVKMRWTFMNVTDTYGHKHVERNQLGHAEGWR